MAMLVACSTVSVLDYRTFRSDKLGNRSVIFGSFTLTQGKIPQKPDQAHSEKNWFSFTLKNINTGKNFVLVELPRDGNYYLALDPGEYTVEEWVFSTKGKIKKCRSFDLHFFLPPRSFIYLGDLAINMKNNGVVEYAVKDDLPNATYLFHERFPGFFPQISKNLMRIHTNQDYYFHLR
jgi:hypothetical protein